MLRGTSVVKLCDLLCLSGMEYYSCTLRSRFKTCLVLMFNRYNKSGCITPGPSAVLLHTLLDLCTNRLFPHLCYFLCQVLLGAKYVAFSVEPPGF